MTSKLCRICFQLITTNNTIWSSTELNPQLIELLLSIKIQQHSQISLTICDYCAQIIECFYSLRLKAMKNDVILNDYINKEYNGESTKIAHKRLKQLENRVRNNSTDKIQPKIEEFDSEYVPAFEFIALMPSEDVKKEWKVFENVDNDQAHDLKIESSSLYSSVATDNTPLSNPPTTTVLELNNEKLSQMSDNAENIDENQQIDTKTSTKVCRECQKIFTTEALLKKHQKTKHKKRRQKKAPKLQECDECHQIVDKKRINEHREKYHLEEASKTCQDCNETFASRRMLLNHRLNKHKDGDMLKCKECYAIFKTKHNYLMHLKKFHHDTNEQRTCVECDKTFATSFLYACHTRRLHVAYKICHICGVKYTTNTHLTTHLDDGLKDTISVENRDKDESVANVYCFKCDQCPKRFKRYINLNGHKKRTHDFRMVTCEVCQKSVRKVQLTKHMIIHKERKFVCNQCPAKFTRSHHLKQHLLVHTGDKPFGCEVCDKKFNDKSTLIKHARRHKRDGDTDY